VAADELLHRCAGCDVGLGAVRHQLERATTHVDDAALLAWCDAPYQRQ
jgi:hypothetical protein